MDATYRCKEILPLFRSDAAETLSGLTFYLRTLEEFIEREHSKEVDVLKRHADSLPKDRQGEFWAWHYPVHWEEIFASQLRSSFVVSLLSLAESHVGMVAEQACSIAASPLKPSDLRGGVFERNRKHLEALAGFTKPSPCVWDSLLEIRDTRNCIVHAQSRLGESKNEQRIRQLVQKLPGLAATYDVLELGPEFPLHALDVVNGFIDALYDESTRLCKRTIDWRP